MTLTVIIEQVLNKGEQFEAIEQNITLQTIKPVGFTNQRKAQLQLAAGFYFTFK